MITHAIALVALIAVLAGWVGVQLAWRSSFPDAVGDGDVLAERIGCGGCDRSDTCAQGAPEEERR